MKRFTILFALTTVFLGGCVAVPYGRGGGDYGGGNGFEQRDHNRGGEGYQGRDYGRGNDSGRGNDYGRGNDSRNGGGWNVSNPGGSDH